VLSDPALPDGDAGLDIVLPDGQHLRVTAKDGPRSGRVCADAAAAMIPVPSGVQVAGGGFDRHAPWHAGPGAAGAGDTGPRSACRRPLPVPGPTQGLDQGAR